MPKWASVVAIEITVLSLGFLMGVGAAWTYASFASSVSNSGDSFAAKHVFPGTRTTSAWDVRDAAAGSESNASGPLAFTDAIVQTTGNWSSAFSTTRYVDVDYNNPLPAGISVSGVRFSFTFADSASGDTACYYFDVRQQSTNTLIGTYGSSASPLHCITTTTQTAFSDAISSSDVGTSDVGNDLRIRVYARESGNKPIKIDLATVSGTGAGSTSFTLYPNSVNDQSTGTASVTRWGPALADGTAYLSGSWATSFATTRYIKFAFPAYLPAGADITSVTLTSSYKSNTSGDTFCYYFDLVLNGGAPITYGSTSSPWCNSTTSFVTQTHDITADANTVAKANAVVFKMYGRENNKHQSSQDLVTLSITWSLS